MGSSAQIDKGPASIHRALGALGHTLADKVFLVLAVLEHFQEFIFGHLEPLKGLLLLDDGVGQSLQSRLVLVGNHSTACLLVHTRNATPFGRREGHTLPYWPCRSRNQVDPRLGGHCRGSSRTVFPPPHLECGPRSARTPSCLLQWSVQTGVYGCRSRNRIPSLSSKSMSSSLQLFSRGRVRSQSSPSTLEMTVRSRRDFEMPLAIAPGVVSHEVPFSSLPLGSEMVISSRGLAV